MGIPTTATVIVIVTVIVIWGQRNAEHFRLIRTNIRARRTWRHFVCILWQCRV